MKKLLEQWSHYQRYGIVPVASGGELNADSVTVEFVAVQFPSKVIINKTLNNISYLHRQLA